MLLSSGPSGSASVASSATTRATMSGRIRKFWSTARVLGKAEEELVVRLDLDVELEGEDVEDDRGEQDRERRDRAG